MKKFKMRWPALKLEVMCDEIPENREALEVLVKNMPIKAIQGHEMVGGWMLRARAVHLRKVPFVLEGEQLKVETMKDAPVGRVSLLFPQGGTTELVVKYDSCADDRDYIPVAQVEEKDLEVLKKAGTLQWQSATRTKEIYHVEFMEVE